MVQFFLSYLMYFHMFCSVGSCREGPADGAAAAAPRLRQGASSINGRDGAAAIGGGAVAPAAAGAGAAAAAAASSVGSSDESSTVGEHGGVEIGESGGPGEGGGASGKGLTSPRASDSNTANRKASWAS